MQQCIFFQLFRVHFQTNKTETDQSTQQFNNIIQPTQQINNPDEPLPLIIRIEETQSKILCEDYSLTGLSSFKI